MCKWSQGVEIGGLFTGSGPASARMDGRTGAGSVDRAAGRRSESVGGGAAGRAAQPWNFSTSATPAQAEKPVRRVPQAVSVATMAQDQSFMIAMEVNS